MVDSTHQPGTGSSLEQLRKMDGRSVQAIAAAAGIARSTYERREVNPDGLTLPEIRSLARIYGLTTTDLVVLLEDDGADAAVRRRARALVPA